MALQNLLAAGLLIPIAKVSVGQFVQAKLKAWTLKSDNIWVLVQALARSLVSSDLG